MGRKRTERKRQQDNSRYVEYEKIPISRLWAREGGICWLCGEKVPDPSLTNQVERCRGGVLQPLDATRDHEIPRAFGGTDHPDNIKLAHFICNNQKGDEREKYYGQSQH